MAHARKDEKTETWLKHDLTEHLDTVAEKAGHFAESFDSADWASLSGAWHDLGKFLPDWQSYIRRKTGYNEEAHIEDGVRPNHSTAGAVLSFEKFKEHPIDRILSYIIAGHHAGLPDWDPDRAGGDLVNRLYENSLEGTLNKRDLEQIKKIPNIQENIALPLPKSSPLGMKSREEMYHCGQYFHLWIRMLFSCLVDADFLDTEAFMTPENVTKRGDYPSVKELSDRFDRFMETKQKNAPDTPINRYRRDILRQCRDKSTHSPGIYSLTVPTGGGKTLSSMAFALGHALAHGKQRIIMAIPYTSIIEQTAKVYKYGSDDTEEIERAVADGNVLFGEDAVLEHHSNIDPDKEDHKSRLATENWDAPIIVTTNVQLFESLLASRTSACRKLHNIVNSVIILDEAQMVPPEYLKPILSVLRGLVQHFGVTVVICTATQPAFTGELGSGQTKFEGLTNIEEIVDNPNDLMVSFERVNVTLPDLTKRTAWKDIADEITQYEQALCIVNTRRDCRDLHALMPQGTIHLSGNMCGEERSEAIADIKSKLKTGEQIRVISTQLVEAGVDLDFPVVYRALAGVDSLAQAAGRCNREGKLNAIGKRGKMVVFQPPKSAPSGLLRKGEDASKTILNSGLKEWGPSLYAKYFKQFYATVNDFDKPRFYERLVLENNDFKFQFRTFAKDVRLIDDTVQRGIIVWYRGKEKNSFDLIDYLCVNRSK